MAAVYFQAVLCNDQRIALIKGAPAARTCDARLARQALRLFECIGDAFVRVAVQRSLFAPLAPVDATKSHRVL
jgi:hypothetical protein